ncbi:hypothetical protein HOY80DRAFT_1140000 [Tuber brumale]|nr:hypothetical protein HOY80DRAFT_1140000 [Tuber brumale]
MTPPEDSDMGFGAVSGQLPSRVDCPCVSNSSTAAPMPGAYYPESSVPPTPSAGCPGYGRCASISASPALFSGCEEEVEFDGSRHPASGGVPTSASTPPPPCGRDGTAEPAITPRCAGLASFTPSTHASYSGSEFSSRTLPARSATPCGHPTPPWTGYSGFDYFEPSPHSDHSSSPPSSHPSSPSSSEFFTNPAACAYLPNGQDNNNLQSSTKEESKSNTLCGNMPRLPSGNPALSEPVQRRALEQHISKLRRRLLFLKAKELRQGLSDKLMQYIVVTEHLLDTELRSGKFTAESNPVSYASKRALELETDVEVGVAKGAAPIELSHIPARKKARSAAKNSDLETAANATAGTRRNSKIPPKKPSHTYSTRRTAPARARAELSASPLFTPPSDPITPTTPTKPESSLPRTPTLRKRAREGDVAMGSTDKKLKMARVGQHKRMPKRKLQEVVTSRKRPRCAKAPPTPPVKSRRLSTLMEELVGEYGPCSTCGERLAKGASAAALANATSSRKRTSENIIVKSPITKRLRKEYFFEGIVLEYESDDDTETVGKKQDKTESKLATPFAEFTTAPTNTATPKSPLTSALGKRTSTATQEFDARDTRNKKSRKEYFQEGMILEYESDEEPATDHKDRTECSTGEMDYDDASYYSPPSSFLAQRMFTARVEDVEEEDEIL